MGVFGRVFSAAVSGALVLPAAQPPPAAFVPSPGSPFVVGPGSGTVVLEDLDRDGRPDLVARHLLTRVITVSMARESGGFGPPRSIAVRWNPADMRIADLTGDGAADLVLTANTTDVVDVLAGDGRGGFSPAPGSPYTLSRAAERLNKRTLHVLDLNEDGHVDIATANGRRVNTMHVLLGEGRGRFTPGPPVALESGRDRYWYDFGDMDVDGHLDIVVTSTSSDAPGSPGRMVVQAGNGRGGFRPAAPPVGIGPGAGPVRLADVDGDGRLDAAVARDDGTISLHLNRGRLPLVAASGPSLGRRGYALRFADINRDGRADLIAATGDGVVVLLRTATGYVPAAGSPYRAGPGAYSFALADVNSDGRLDLAVPAFDGDAVTILLAR